jgi:hypothetical protein
MRIDQNNCRWLRDKMLKGGERTKFSRISYWSPARPDVSEFMQGINAVPWHFTMCLKSNNKISQSYIADGNFWVDELDVNDYVVRMSVVTKLRIHTIPPPVGFAKLPPLYFDLRKCSRSHQIARLSHQLQKRSSESPTPKKCVVPVTKFSISTFVVNSCKLF